MPSLCRELKAGTVRLAPLRFRVWHLGSTIAYSCGRCSMQAHSKPFYAEETILAVNEHTFLQDVVSAVPS